MRPETRGRRAAAWRFAPLLLSLLPRLALALMVPLAGTALGQDDAGQQDATRSAAQAPPTFHPLRPDAPVEFTTGEGDPDTDGGTGRCRLFALTPTRDGLVTISAESLDGDAYIRVIEPGPAPRKVLLADDDGGVEWNPRLVVETKTGEPLHLDIGFKVLREGTLSVKAAAGEVPALQGRELDEARLAFLRGREARLQAPAEIGSLAQNLNLQTEALWRLHAFTECAEVSSRLLEMGRKLDHAVVQMVAEGRLGASLSRGGDPEQGVEMLRSAIRRSVAAGHEPFEMFAQDELGIAFTGLDRLEEAQGALERALELARTAASVADHMGIAESFGRLGLELNRHGRFAEALDTYAAVRESARLTGDRGTESLMLAASANVHLELGQYESALDLANQAIAVGGDVLTLRNQVMLQLVLSNIHRGLGRLDVTRNLLLDALKIEGLAEAPRDRGHLLSALTRLYYETGDLELAAERATQQAELGRKLGLVDVEAMGLNNVAVLALRNGRREEALSAADRALDLIRSEGDTAERITIMGTRIEVALAAQDVALASDLLIEAEVMSASLAAEKIGIEWASVARATNRWALLGEYQQDLVALKLADGVADRHEADRALEDGFVRIGRWRSRALLETMAQRRTQDVDRYAAVTPEELRRTSLPEGGTLVHFADGVERLYAYTVDRNGTRWHDLGKRSVVQEKMQAFLAGISRPDDLASPATVARLGGELYELLLKEPLVGARGSGALIIVPTPALASLPFESLVVAAEATPSTFADVQFLIDQREVSYAPSAPVLRLLADLTTEARPRAGLLIADPDYESPRPSLVAARAERLPALPGTRGEALAIARILNRQPDDRLDEADRVRDVRIDLDGLEIALGREASSAVLEQDLSRYSVLHFATHGVIDEQDARLSGLVLSQSDGDDGFLSVDEISRLRIDADLAVLSACETARGQVRRGEGVQSMARALMYAGARSVVASLWQVDDAETKRIMEAFYSARTDERVSDSAALRRARLSIRQATSAEQGFAGVGRGGSLGGGASRRGASGRSLVGHPYFWAPFIYMGPAR